MMQVKNKLIKLASSKELTVDYIENEIEKYGEPLRWAIVKKQEELLFVHAVIIK